MKDGSYTVPRDYINTQYAQSFLNFGVDPKGGNEHRTSYNIYKQEVNGKIASRVIYNPAQIHPWNTVSSSVATSSIEFFQDAFGAPNPIAPNNQVWQIKEIFNFIGLIGFVMFIGSFTKALLYTAPFSSLKASRVFGLWYPELPQ